MTAWDICFWHGFILSCVSELAAIHLDRLDPLLLPTGDCWNIRNHFECFWSCILEMLTKKYSLNMTSEVTLHKLKWWSMNWGNSIVIWPSWCFLMILPRNSTGWFILDVFEEVFNATWVSWANKIDHLHKPQLRDWSFQIFPSENTRSHWKHTYLTSSEQDPSLQGIPLRNLHCLKQTKLNVTLMSACRPTIGLTSSSAIRNVM